MKELLFFLCLLQATFSFGQKWGLTGDGYTKEFPYGYRFNFQHAGDSCSYTKEKLPQEDTSTIQISGFYGELLDSIEFKLTDYDTKLPYYFTTDSIGQVKTLITPGEYVLKIVAKGYDYYMFTFVVRENEALNINVTLGLSSELFYYVINSKIELSSETIEGIIECVWQNRKFNLNVCNEAYYKVSLK